MMKTSAAVLMSFSISQSPVDIFRKYKSDTYIHTGICYLEVGKLGNFQYLYTLFVSLSL